MRPSAHSASGACSQSRSATESTLPKNVVDFGSSNLAIQLALGSMTHLCALALPGMKERRFGRIAQIVSIAGLEVLDGLILSNASRPAVLGFAKALSREVASDHSGPFPTNASQTPCSHLRQASRLQGCGAPWVSYWLGGHVDQTCVRSIKGCLPPPDARSRRHLSSCCQYFGCDGLVPLVTGPSSACLGEFFPPVWGLAPSPACAQPA